MNKLLKFPDMKQMAIEMANMINETLNEDEDDEEVLIETDNEVEKVLGEITAGIELPAAPALRAGARNERGEKVNG